LIFAWKVCPAPLKHTPTSLKTSTPKPNWRSQKRDF